MTDPGLDLVAAGVPVEWPDPAVTVRARLLGEQVDGALGELVVWLSGCQAQVPPRMPSRIRCLVLDDPAATVTALAADVGVTLRGLAVPPDATPDAAFALGLAAADAEVDGGTDLLVVAGRSSQVDAALLVCLLTSAEPVSLLPRGAAAVDTARWIADAAALRDGRLRLAEQRHDPNALLAGLDDPRLVALTAVIMRAVARRTPVVLDGTAAVAGALLCQDTQPRTGRWWRVADDAADPAHRRAVGDLGVQPLQSLGLTGGDGTAGLLCVPLVRAAVALAGAAAASDAGSPEGT